MTRWDPVSFGDGRIYEWRFVQVCVECEGCFGPVKVGQTYGGNYCLDCFRRRHATKPEGATPRASDGS